MPFRSAPTFLSCAALAVFAAGCGGNERQDADEPKGTWRVEIVDAEFPPEQHIAKQETMRITVRNEDDSEIPNVAVTVDSFTRRSEQADLADPTRPVWIVDDSPSGGTTAYANTWALGSVPPGTEKTFEWKVTPVVAGDHEVSYRVSAGLDGKAKARVGSGGRPEGSFDISVSRRPAKARVDPDTGEVERR